DVAPFAAIRSADGLPRLTPRHNSQNVENAGCVGAGLSSRTGSTTSTLTVGGSGGTNSTTGSAGAGSFTIGGGCVGSGPRLCTGQSTSIGGWFPVCSANSAVTLHGRGAHAGLAYSGV